ncbi:MAG: GNAT family N-acetyltransferase [Burkholderiaceae bacterium]|nr:GNAT family N-acetyltransferase [Burkholderiaceae bacterium]
MPELDLQPADGPAHDAAWDALVARSPQGTLFAESAFLRAVGCPHQRWWLMQGQAIKAGLLLPTSADGRAVVADDLVIHAGPLLDLDPARQAVKRRHDAFTLCAFVAAELPRRFDRVELPLAPQIDDLRPFLWHAYHGPSDQQYRPDLRYTSYLDIAALADAAPEDAETGACFEAMETVRRYSVREARRKGGRVAVVRDSAPLLAYYRALMQAQGEPAPEDKLAAMQRVMDGLIARARGAMFHVHDAAGKLLYCVFYGWDARRAYYLYGAGHPQASAPWQGTLAHWFAFGHLAREHGVREVDLEGVNSPQRGWFKLSFGGSLVPYHTLRWGPAA